MLALYNLSTLGLIHWPYMLRYLPSQFGTFLLIFGILFYFLFEFIERKELKLIYNEMKINSNPVNISNSPFLFILNNSKGKPIPREYYEIRINYWNYTKNDKDFVITEIPLEDCDLEKHFTEFKDIFNSTIISDHKCLNKNFDLSLFGKYGNSESSYSFINIAINMCNNKTTDNKCPSKEILETKLKNVFLSFKYIDHEINHNDLINPVNPVVFNGLLSFNWDIHSRYFYYFRNLFYSTDLGLIIDNENTIQKYIFEKYDQSVSIRHGSALYPNLTIGTMTIIGNDISAIYNKSFPKLQLLISRIGGIINSIITFSQIIAYFYTKNLFIIDLFSVLFFTETI